MKKKISDMLIAGLGIAIAVIIIWGINNRTEIFKNDYDDGIEQVDLTTIHLVNSDVDVRFSEVLLNEHHETRKLIVSEQNATVLIELSDTVMNLNWDLFKKSQEVSYTGTGYFVVDLDNLTKEDFVQDEKHKTLTIRINHAYLQAIEINPDNIQIGELKKGFLNRSDIELTVSDYKIIENTLCTRLKTEFDTVANGQKADEMALRMVKEIYEPVVQAIEPQYNVYVEFI